MIQVVAPKQVRISRAIQVLCEIGTAGSGDRGHPGRPGEVGGSGMTASDMLRNVAKIHQQAVHAPNDPATVKAYTSFKQQVLQQYHDLLSKGYHFTFSSKDPYTSSKDMRGDVENNHHLSVYNESNDLQPDHPLAEMTPDGQTYNTIFRGVHDIYGHAFPGNQWGPKGELAAYQAHSKMFTADAIPALAAETLAQNAWVNYGPHHPEDLSPSQRPFAPQKAYAFPSDIALPIARGVYPSTYPLNESKTNDDEKEEKIVNDLPDEDYRRPQHERDEPIKIVREGGIGSGHWAHRGIPGHRGGSAPSNNTSIPVQHRVGAQRRLSVKAVAAFPHYSNDEGFTFNVRGTGLPKHGYAVGGAGNEKVLDPPITAVQVQDYIRDNLSTLARDGHYFGAWADNGKVYFDITTVMEGHSKADALEQARERDQIAVWGIDEGRSFNTMSDGNRPSESQGDPLYESQQHVTSAFFLFGKDQTAKQIADTINKVVAAKRQIISIKPKVDRG